MNGRDVARQRANCRDRSKARTRAFHGSSRRRTPPRVAGGVLVLVAAAWTSLAGTALVPAASAAQAALPTVTLVQAAPPVGAALDGMPASVTLTFDRNLVRGTLTVTGPRGDAAGAAGIYGATLTAPLVTGLPPGTYTVSWTAKAEASPPSRGSYSFRFTGLGAPPVATSPVPSPSGPPTPTTTTSTGTAGNGSGPRTGAGPAGPPSARPLPHPGRTLAAVVPPVVTPTPAGAPPAANPATPVPPTTPAPPTTQPEISRTAGNVDSATSDPDDVMAGSPTLAYGLIGAAVLLQLAAGLWGLWRWRQGTGVDQPGPVDHGLLAPATAAALMHDPWADSAGAVRGRPAPGRTPR